MVQFVGARGSACGRVYGRRAPSWASCRRLPFGFDGLVVRSMEWMADIPFNAVIRPDWDEITRRAGYGLGPVTGWELQRALRALPYGVRVGWEMIDPIISHALEQAPAGVIDASARGALRLVRPPVELIGVYAVSAHPEHLHEVAWLLKSAPTGLVLTRHPPQLSETAARAERYGAGLALRQHGRFQVLCSPVSRTRPSFNRARLLEALYGWWRYGIRPYA